MESESSDNQNDVVIVSDSEGHIRSKEFRSTKGAIFLTVIASVVAIAFGFKMHTNYFVLAERFEEARMQRRQVNKSEVDQIFYDANLAWVGAMVAFFVATIGMGVFSLRSSLNAMAMGANGMTVPPDWSFVVWFIPLVNLYYPYIVIKEIQQASDNPGNESWKLFPPDQLIELWWGSIILGIAISIAAVPILIYHFPSGLYVAMIPTFLAIATTVLFYRIANRISDVQSSWWKEEKSKMVESCPV